MVLWFYVDDCIVFIPLKDNSDAIYAWIEAYLKIEDYGDLNDYLVIELNHRSDG